MAGQCLIAGKPKSSRGEGGNGYSPSSFFNDQQLMRLSRHITANLFFFMFLYFARLERIK
jgi:hypothetical protein